RTLVDDSDKAVKGMPKEEAEALHEKNRRVEFNILEQDVTKKKVSVDATTGKETVLEEKTSEEKKELAEPESPDKKATEGADKKKEKKPEKKSDKKDEKKK